MIEIEGIRKIKIKPPNWKDLLLFAIILICIIKQDYILIVFIIQLIYMDQK